jgi:hypothetical protein
MPNPKGHEPSLKDSRFKAAWQSGPTRTIRVPIALAEVTWEYARQLDKGIEPHDTAEMFDKGTDVMIHEPRDTRIQSDTQTDNKVDNIVTEPRDTAKIQAELESIRANYDALLGRCWIRVWWIESAIAQKWHLTKRRAYAMSWMSVNSY